MEEPISPPTRNQRYYRPSYALVYAGVLPRLQEIGRGLGYAVAVHGSMATDLDLLACPWTEDAAEPQALIDAFCAFLGLIYTVCPPPHPQVRPHGRLSWALHFDPGDPYLVGGPYIDVSVMPKR